MSLLLPTALILFLVSLSNALRPPFSCDESDARTKSFPFCNTSWPISTRVRDLASRLTLDEKIKLTGSSSAAIPRLNIPAYEWWSESIHGVSPHGMGFDLVGSIRSTTQFPQVILTAATFDPHLWYRIAQATGDEARAIFNRGEAKGMTFMAPTINLFRDPRWGRGQETPGEDPLVAAKYGVAYVRGIQGDSFEGGRLEKEGILKASACCKHFTAYDLESWNHTTRYRFDAKVSKQDMAEMYQPPLEACVKQGKASSIMCSYNRVNGVQTCADRNLLYEIPRRHWGFHGYVISDCDSVHSMFDGERYKEPEDAVAAALKAGIDVNCGIFFLNYLKSAIAKKKVSEMDVDRAVHNVLSMRMRLGLFNGDTSKLEYGDINGSRVCSKDHQDLALEAARSGIVLLKNELGLLPLSKEDTKLLAVIGPNANNPLNYLGNYEGPPCRKISLLQALQTCGGGITLKHHQGCNAVNCSTAFIDEAVEIAQQADYVVLVMGLDLIQEGEFIDRVELGLPGYQEKLVTAVADAARRPVVLVLVCGGPVDVSFAKENPKIASILWAGYPGQAGDLAIAQTLFGHNNPGGRLPVTWYPKELSKVAMTDMRMRPDPSTGYPGRTYRFYTGPTVYEFGYGLSYTNYYYEFIAVTLDNLYLQAQSPQNALLNSSRWVSVSQLGKGYCKKIKFSAYVRVTNHGDMAGKHPVLLFVKSGGPSMYPRKRLIGFESLTLRAGQSEDIEFVVNPCEHFSYADEQGKKVIEQGTLHLVVGDDRGAYPIRIVN
ncbi:probable beta-D-xylosidase 7 [Salvia miltiorrhiza]|uniref:probable beta-D-xylosidase 7 n=1 Tax=Salvia miltiorrhiza TaxID=226208 RepID=UPI0025ACA91D|nr:probable beta-D-xylosidase 7 [Salvia miltiorrhiza]